MPWLVMKSHLFSIVLPPWYLTLNMTTLHFLQLLRAWRLVKLPTIQALDESVWSPSTYISNPLLKLQFQDLISSNSVKGSRLKVQSHPLGPGSRHHQKCVSLPRRNPKQTFPFNLPHKTDRGGQVLGQDTLLPDLPFLVHTCRQIAGNVAEIVDLLMSSF